MPVYVTGRQRRLANSFAVASDHFGYLSPSSFDLDGNEIVGELSQCYPQSSVENYWQDPWHVGRVRITSGTSKTSGYLVECWDGFGGYDSDDTRQLVPGGGTWGYTDALTGTGKVWIDTEECIELLLMLDVDDEQTDEEGFPKLPHLDERGFVDSWTLAAKDGLLSWYGRVYERTKVGGYAGAEFSGVGAYGSRSVSASVSTAITVSFEVSHQAVYTNHINGSSNKGKGYSSTLTLDYNGLSVSPSYERTQGSTTAAVSGSVSTVSVPGLYDGSDHGGTATVVGEGERRYRLDAALLSPDGTPYGGTLSARWSSGRRYDPATSLWRTKPESFSLDPGCTVESTQRTYTVGSYLEGATQTGVSADEACPVQAWLHLDGSQEDARDFRLQLQTNFLTWRPAASVSQAASTPVASDKTLTSTDASLPLTESNLEGYRYLRFSAASNFAPKELTLTIGGKQYKATTGTSGVATELTVDLCLPSNLPEGFVKDHRDSRYPLQGPATPITEEPKIDLADEDNGWLFGCLERPASIAFSGLTAGNTLALTSVRLVRDASAEAGSLSPFDDDDRALKGWESETDDTYLTPCLWLYSDHKQATLVPYRARVVPKSGDSPYWVYWSLADLETFAGYIPGWTVSFATPPAYPHLDGNPLSPLFGSHLDAAHLAEAVWGGEDWSAQTALGVPCSLSVPYRLDLVSVPPGTGDMDQDYDPEDNTVTHLYAPKALRAQAEGLVLPAGTPLTVKLVESSSGGSRGQGDSDAVYGAYRTGSPYAPGNASHITRLEYDYKPFEGPFRAQNRMRHRTSFRTLAPSTGSPLSYDVSHHMFHAKAFMRSGNVWIGEAQNSFAGGWRETDTGIAATWAALRLDKSYRRQVWHLLTEESGSVKHRTSLDLANWTMATTIGTGTKPALYISPRGDVYAFRIDSGAVKLNAYDRAGTSLYSGTPSGIGSVDDAGLAVDGSTTKGGNHRLVLLATVSGGQKMYTSDDNGRTWS